MLKAWVFVFLISTLGAWASKPKITLSPIVTEELGVFFSHAHQLQRYLYQKQEPQIKAQIQQTIQHIDKLMNVAKVEDQRGAHLNKVLSTISSELQMARSVQGKQQVEFLQKAYKQIVMLYQSYQVEKKYDLYFCNIGRSVWIQEPVRGSKPHNPFDPDSKCGKKIY